VPGFNKPEHRFLVEGKDAVLIAFDSRHASLISKAYD
jgi:hypothetical protein